MQFDIVVIGAGVIGLAIAEVLAGKNIRLAILEKNDAHGRETSSRNSEVIHAGIYYPKAFLKSRLCVTGNPMLYDWCRRHEVPHRRTGKLIVATSEEEEAELERIRETATDSGVEGLTLCGKTDVRSREPGISARAALFSPNTGIIDSHRLMRSLLIAAEQKGAVLACHAEVTAIRFDGRSWDLGINGDEYRLQTKIVVNSAGLWADHIAALAGIDVAARGWRLQFCKGNYFTAAPSPKLNHLVYPVPARDNVSLGIHATLNLAGQVRFGPDSRYVPSLDYTVDEDRREAFREAVSRYLPGMTGDALHPDMCGIRPKLQGPGDPPRDFVIQEESAAGFPGLINLIGMESPGLTSCLAIAAKIGGRSPY